MSRQNLSWMGLLIASCVGAPYDPLASTPLAQGALTSTVEGDEIAKQVSQPSQISRAQLDLMLSVSTRAKRDKSAQQSLNDYLRNAASNDRRQQQIAIFGFLKQIENLPPAEHVQMLAKIRAAAGPFWTIE